jgi:hypothetical protein
MKIPVGLLTQSLGIKKRGKEKGNFGLIHLLLGISANK